MRLSRLVILTLSVVLSVVAVRAQDPDFVVWINRGDLLAFHKLGCQRLGVDVMTEKYSLTKMTRKLISPCPVCGKELAPQIAAWEKWKEEEPARIEAKRRSDEAKRKADGARAESLRMAGEARAKRLAGPLPVIPRAQLTKTAATIAAGVENLADAFSLLFATEVRKLAPEYDGLFILHTSDELLITVNGPVWKYGNDVSERVRKFISAPAAAPWTTNYTVSIIAKQIDAPSIERIILQRNSVVVAPLASTLKPSLKVTRMNAKAIVNEGDLTFSASAFAPAPGLKLRLIAIPTVGSNIEYTFTIEELHSIR